MEKVRVGLGSGSSVNLAALLLLLLMFIYIYFYAYEGFACMYVGALCACLKRALDPLELELDSCELPLRAQAMNPDPLEEQPVLLSAEPLTPPLALQSAAHSLCIR